jgi:two-component system nitrogen regulation sensor histidine kinase GlnL
MLLVLSRNKACGHPPKALFLAADKLTEMLDHAIANGQPFTEREAELVLTNGDAITLDLSVNPMWEAGSHRAVLVEAQQVDRHLRIAREEALINQQQATQALLRGMAHEIKNPLGGLRGAAQLLERELPDESLHEFTQVIIGEADRLQNLVNRLFGPSALPHKAPLNVHEVLERVRHLVVAESPAGVELVRDYDPSIPDIFADQDQLIQVLLNLVRNAVQAVGDSGRILMRSRVLRQFTIGHQRHKLVLRIDVVDDGAGVPPALQDKIFYPMVTGRADGTGLGLSIAQSLVNQHGGLIECESAVGNTCFSILLPVEDNHAG